MLVGFKISALNGYRDEARAFIERVCFMESGIADNILDTIPTVNIYTGKTTIDELDQQQFSYEPIHIEAPYYLMISKVDFNLEIPAGSSVIKLAPAEFRLSLLGDKEKFLDYVRLGIISFLPEISWGDLVRIFDETFDNTFN